MTEADAFERAILDTPDDVNAYAAYADWLQDRDDPRGAFIAVQLALEDSSRPTADRRALQEQEAQLLAAHERDWLGDLAPHLLDGDDTRPRAEDWWARGFLTEVRVEALTFAFAQALAATPTARTLRALRIESSLHPAYRGDAKPAALLPPGETAYESYFELIGSPCLENLRSFQMGDSGPDADDGVTDTRAYASGLEHVVACMPRVEELQLLCDGYNARVLFSLPNLTRLQVLRVVGIGAASLSAESAVPLDALVRNPALVNLTHLLVHPDAAVRGQGPLPLAQVRELLGARYLPALTHLQLRHSDTGDEGINALIQSPLLPRLEWLDLRNGVVTDHGARALARCTAAQGLRRLDLSRNQITQNGLGELKRAGVNAVVSTAPSRREQAELDRRARAQRGGYYNGDDERDGDWE